MSHRRGSRNLGQERGRTGIGSERGRAFIPIRGGKAAHTRSDRCGATRDGATTRAIVRSARAAVPVAGDVDRNVIESTSAMRAGIRPNSTQRKPNRCG